MWCVMWSVVRPSGMVHACQSCMADTKQKVSVHAKKYYKVVLEEIDRNRETPETFALKLSVRTRTTLPRAKGLIRHLPRTVRQALSANQANKLKAVLEDIGGRARIESYLVTPGEGREKQKPEPEAEAPDSVAEDGTITCPECGQKEEAGAKFCTFCHRRFRDKTTRPNTLADRAPDDNPLEGEDFLIEEEKPTWAEWLKANPIWIAGAIVLIALLIAIIK